MTEQEKLYHFESMPAEKNWDKIAIALDEHTTPYADRLFHFEETPPLNIWTKLQDELENGVQEPAKVVPFFQRYSRPLKYVTAAAVLCVSCNNHHLIY